MTTRNRRHSSVTQAEIARALRAVVQVGLPAAILIEPDGTIKINVGPSREELIARYGYDWRKVLDEHERAVAKVKEITL